MEVVTLVKTVSEFGVSSTLVLVVYFLLKYLKDKDGLISELLTINQTQNDQMKDTNNLLKELTEHQKDCREYSKYGYWWIFNHQPTMELCNACKDFDTCPHPRRVLKR